LLQKHRHDGDQHSCQIACILWADLFQPKRHTASTSTAIEAAVPTGKLLRAIADNYAIDKHPKVQAWLARHPCWTFHFTPTSACGSMPSMASSPAHQPTTQAGRVPIHRRTAGSH
jgi:hypothetical protein